MDSVLINRVFNYRKTIDFNKFPDEISFYNRFYINKARRNPILWAVPSMYRIIRNSKREFAGETWNKFKPNSDNKYLLQVNVETASGVHSVMNTVQNFLRPDIYEVLMTQNGILSPFHRLNSSYYKYEVTRLSSQNAEISFRPYVYNTKLVRGSAIVDPETGRVLSVTFFGEFDMIRFSLSAIMGDDGPKSLFPKRCDIHSRFKFMGNLIETDHYSEYSLPTILPDSISERQDKTMMASLRPEPLPPHIAKLYHTKDSLDSIARTHEDTIKVEKKPSLAKLILWDSFADHLLNRTRLNLGKNDSYIRLDPLFNPLYFGYNNNKGVTYKIKLRLVYNLNENQEIYMQFKGGYAFKQDQFYFNVPFRWTYDRRHEGYVELMVGNGNRISNSSVRERLQEINKDSIKTLDWDKLNLDYFKDFHVRGFAHHNLSDYFSDPDGEDLHYDINFSVSGVAHMAPNGSVLSISSLGYGLTEASITASDARSEKCSATFMILVPDNSREVDLYPNPVKKELNIKSAKTGPVAISISNKAGATIFSGNYELRSVFEPITIDLGSAAAGTYYVSISGAGIDKTYEIVKI